MLEKVELLQKSWLRCYENNIPRDLKHPRLFASEQQMKDKIEKNKILIKIFNDQLHIMSTYYNIRNCFIILTDNEGMVISRYFSKNYINKINKYWIKEGVYLTEESCGTNAISLAMIKKSRITTKSNDYYCSFLQGFDNIAEPILINNNIIGYVNITISSQHHNSSVSIILNHLISNISLKYINDTIFTNKENNLLSQEEYEVLQYTALGYSVREISNKLHVSQSTVKYRRKVLCEKLEASNIVHAVAISFANSILKITII